MKAFRKYLGSLAIIGGLIGSLIFVHAQTITKNISGGVILPDGPNVDWSSASDVEVAIQAIASSAEPTAAELVSRDGIFVSASEPMGPPLPGSMGWPAWNLGDDGTGLTIWLLDDLVQPQMQMRAMAMDIPLPGDGEGDDGTNNYAPDYSTQTVNYGTNLWIANFALSSGNAAGIVSNTAANVPYEIQYVPDLTSTQWQSPGWFVYGSELTNWTALALANVSLTDNAFFRIRSWASSDGSGLPDWWELEYFGTIGIDPYGDPMGDGWSNLQKFQNGMNPNVFYTPPTPSGVTVIYNVTNGTATVSWLPSPGPVTSYTVNFNGTSYTVPAGVNSLTASYSAVPFDIAGHGPNTYSYFQVQANYNGGSSLQNSTSLEAGYGLEINLIPGPQGTAYLAVGPATVPVGTTAIRWTRIDIYAQGLFGNPSFNTNWDIPISSLANGLYLLPAYMLAAPVDGYGHTNYAWWVQTVGVGGGANGEASEIYLGNLPFYDGRAQLKQNLIFLLREPNADGPFTCDGIGTMPATYAYAGFYDVTYPGSGPVNTLNSYRPFMDNYLYRNLVFSAADVDANGSMTTGVTEDGNLELNGTPTYQFQPPPGGALLGTNQTQWLVSYPFVPGFYLETNGVYYDLASIGILYTLADPGITYTMVNSTRNYFGLLFRSVNLAYDGGGSLETYALTPGNAYGPLWDNLNFYPETAQPQFQMAEYDFWNAQTDLLPGGDGFSPANQSRMLFNFIGQTWTPDPYGYGVPNPVLQVAGYAKLAVTNGYPGVYGYLQQYFDKAYRTDANGIATTNTTGVLSPYGQFFATEPGAAALVTMPDIDTGARGTCTVYSVSLQFDKNHDGTMDLSFSGADATSSDSPMEFWVNNGLIIPGTGGNLDQDVRPATNGPVNYSFKRITCQRDLENFTRLWICGMPPLPANQGYAVKLEMLFGNNNPAINLYWSCETNGGIGYLTDTNMAAMQMTAISINGGPPTGCGVSLGTVSNNCSYTFPDGTFAFGGTQYLLFEGAGIGSGELLLTISQNGNTIAQTGVWLDLHDVQDFFEQNVIQDNMSGAKSNWTSYVEMVQPAIASALGNDTNLIVLVHGINVRPWDCVNDAETVFKRLYWAGFQGSFAEVKWPCNLLTPIPSPLSPAVFNDSELQGYKASTALTTCLNGLKTRFPNYRLNILAHSQGNTVVSEAIKNGAPFDTYILTQGALPDSAYDVDAPADADLVARETGSNITPEWQPMGYRGVYTNSNFAGRVVNFYNPLDKVLGYWVTDQKILKPSAYVDSQLNLSYYSYDGINSYFTPYLLPGYLVTDPEESRADVSRSRTLPIGQSGPASAHGVIQSAVDLNAQFGFNGNTTDEHSAQWTRPIQTSWGYYDQILESCLIHTIQRQ